MLANGEAFQVIGVLPPEVGFPSILNHFYVPVHFSPDETMSRGEVFLKVAARRRPGVARSAAEAETSHDRPEPRRRLPSFNLGSQMGAIPVQEAIVGNV